jgi:hypothetical protein
MLRRALAIGLLTVGMAGWSSPVHGQYGQMPGGDPCLPPPVAADWVREPCWEIATDLLWLGRGHAAPEALLIADVGGTQIDVLSASDLQFEISAGVHSELIVHRSEGWGYELGYLSAFDQRARRSISIDPATPNLNSVTYQFFGVTGGADTAYGTEYQSDLQSGELNLRLREWGGLVPVVGVRWYQLTEELELFEAAAPSSGVLSEVDNDLFGVQAGIRAPLWTRGGWFRVETTIKLGLFAIETNLYADTHTAAGPTLVLDRSFDSTAVASEIHLTAVWQVSDWLAFRAGYTGIWLTDVALAADQSDNFDLATGAGVLDRSTLAMHGGHIGFAVAW